MALVGDGRGADRAALPRADVAGRVEFGKCHRLARPGPGTAVRRVGVGLEAAEPLIDVSDEARLGVFAVVDDVDAELDLLADDLLDRARKPCAAGRLVDRLALLARQQSVEQVGRSRQRAGVGGEDAAGALLHGNVPITV